jgi:hypothetical protein
LTGLGACLTGSSRRCSRMRRNGARGAGEED